MPGTNHDIEAGFLDNLSFSLRPAASDLLMHFRLKQLLEMRQSGPTEDLEKRFDLTLPQWFTVLDAVILTKISYFRIVPEMKTKHLDILQKAAGIALHQPGMGLDEIYRKTEQSYSYFSQTILKMLEVRRIKSQLRKK